MSTSTLRTQIAELHAVLSKTTAIDAETRDALSALQDNIARILNTSLLAASKHDETLAERLEELAVRFESEHPAAGTAIREVVNTLVKAGI